MLRAKLKIKSSIWFLWITVCVVLLVLPLIVNLVEFSVFSRHFNEQIAERNKFALDVIGDTIDEQLVFVETLSANLALNKEVREIVKDVSLPLDANDNFKLYNFVHSFSSIFGNDGYSDRVFIYFTHLDLVAKSGATQSSDSFYNTYLSKATDRDYWREFISANHAGDYFVMDFHGKKDEIFYIKTVPILYNDLAINIILNFDKDNLSMLVSKLYMSQIGQLDILDQSDNVILQIGSVTEKEEQTVEELLRKRNILSYESRSEVNGWKYIYLLPRDVVYEEINHSKTLVLLLIFGGFLICAGLAVEFLRFNYSEINYLTSLFTKEKKPVNEYSFLREKIESSLVENKQLSEEINEQNIRFRENVLTALLEGRGISGEHTKTELLKLELDFNEDLFLVVLYALNQNEAEDGIPKSFVINNIFSELLERYNYRHHKLNHKNAVAYIVRLDGEKDRENIWEALKFTYDFIEENLGFTFYGALGNVHKKQSGIALSYQEACQTLEYLMVLKKPAVNDYILIKDKLLQNYFYSPKMEEQLINLVKINDKQKLHIVLEEIFKRNEKDGSLSLNSARYLVVNLFNTIKRFLMQYGVAIEQTFADECKFVDNISEYESVDDMVSIIFTVYENCYDKALHKLEVKEELSDKIISYIRQNYKDQMLGVQMIADEFSLSRDYVARRFKEKTQMRINDYINMVRVDKAKEYLSETNNLILGIAEQVGFSNYRTFVRVFTNVTGISPKQYRNINKQKNGGNKE